MNDVQQPEGPRLGTGRDRSPLHEVGYLVHSFDLLNVGHLDLIRQAARLCRSLHVGVAPNDLVIELLGCPPVVPLEERLELVRHLRWVDSVVAHRHGAAPLEALLLTAEGEQFVPTPDLVLQPRRSTASVLLRRATASSLVEGRGQVPA